jgi:Bacterial TSP3 repeat
VVTQDTLSDASSVDTGADRLADTDEAAVGTDPTSPNSGGDGYDDGDEANLKTDPLDPVSVPATQGRMCKQ